MTLRHLFFRWLAPKAPLEVRERLAQWRILKRGSAKITLDNADFFVVDTETTGLNPDRDKLVSVGAVSVRQERIILGSTFHGILRQSHNGGLENILLHGITPGQQAQGEEPAYLLMNFLELIGKVPLVAFHAPFDRVFLNRALKQYMGVGLVNPMLDLAYLMPALYPHRERSPGSAVEGLDGWVRYFGLSVINRHSAEEDALVTAELFLIALAQAKKQGLRTIRDLFSLAKNEYRLNPPRGDRG
ncbi:MAG: 3'-5' exonuclease [Deltaproteobacteria bacterium]|nr:3'-5' exonuclease [Deltaproteobacteria bacterium]